MTLSSDPKYRALAGVAAKGLGTSDADIINAILAQWTCEKGNADPYPPVRNNPGNLARGAAQGLGFPFHIDNPNPQPGNPIVTFETPTDGAKAYAKLLATGSRYAGVRAAVKAGDGHAFIVAVGASGYGTGTACMLAAYHPATTPTPPDAATHTMTIQHGAIVRVYTAHDGCITGWNDSQWMGKTSSASCTKPRHLDTCDGQSGATVVKKLTGTLFKGRFVRVGEGVTVEPRG